MRKAATVIFNPQDAEGGRGRAQESPRIGRRTTEKIGRRKTEGSGSRRSSTERSRSLLPTSPAARQELQAACDIVTTRAIYYHARKSARQKPQTEGSEQEENETGEPEKRTNSKLKVAFALIRGGCRAVQQEKFVTQVLKTGHEEANKERRQRLLARRRWRKAIRLVLQANFINKQFVAGKCFTRMQKQLNSLVQDVFAGAAPAEVHELIVNLGEVGESLGLVNSELAALRSRCLASQALLDEISSSMNEASTLASARLQSFHFSAETDKRRLGEKGKAPPTPRPPMLELGEASREPTPRKRRCAVVAEMQEPGSPASPLRDPSQLLAQWMETEREQRPEGDRYTLVCAFHESLSEADLRQFFDGAGLLSVSLSLASTDAQGHGQALLEFDCRGSADAALARSGELLKEHAIYLRYRRQEISFEGDNGETWAPSTDCEVVPPSRLQGHLTQSMSKMETLRANISMCCALRRNQIGVSAESTLADGTQGIAQESTLQAQHSSADPILAALEDILSGTMVLASALGVGEQDAAPQQFSGLVKGLPTGWTTAAAHDKETVSAGSKETSRMPPPTPLWAEVDLKTYCHEERWVRVGKLVHRDVYFRGGHGGKPLPGGQAGVEAVLLERKRRQEILQIVHPPPLRRPDLTLPPLGLATPTAAGARSTLEASTAALPPLSARSPSSRWGQATTHLDSCLSWAPSAAYLDSCQPWLLTPAASLVCVAGGALVPDPLLVTPRLPPLWGGPAASEGAGGAAAVPAAEVCPPLTPQTSWRREWGVAPLRQPCGYRTPRGLRPLWNEDD